MGSGSKCKSWMSYVTNEGTALGRAECNPESLQPKLKEKVAESKREHLRID